MKYITQEQVNRSRGASVIATHLPYMAQYICTNAAGREANEGSPLGRDDQWFLVSQAAVSRLIDKVVSSNTSVAWESRHAVGFYETDFEETSQSLTR